MELPKPIQEAAYLSGRAARFVIDQLTLKHGWSEMPGNPNPVSKAHLEFYQTPPNPNLPTVTAEHEGGLPQLTEAHRKAA